NLKKSQIESSLVVSMRLLPNIKVSAIITDDLKKDIREPQASTSITQGPAALRPNIGIRYHYLFICCNAWDCGFNLILLSGYTFLFFRLFAGYQWHNIYQIFSASINDIAYPGGCDCMVLVTH
ncbi:MAG: hypothetical protein JSV54_02745, partial [Chloroflexota bacterium]